MRIPKLFGTTTNSPIPVPISLYLTLAASDYLNFEYANSYGGSSLITSGTTINMTSLAVGATKTFVIDHPDEVDKYLVHGCLEGPEAGVYYRGEGIITNNESVIIELPKYVKNLAYRFTVQITQIYDGKHKTFGVSRVKDNKFTVYGENGEFFWLVHGVRHDIQIEPNKKDIVVKGSGPYKWI